MMTRSLLHGGGKALAAALALAAFAAAPALAAGAPRARHASAAASQAPGSAVAAPDPSTFALTAVGSPGAIDLHGDAGSVLHGDVAVRNRSRHPITVIVQSAELTNAANGSADYVTAHPAGTGLWLGLSTGRVRLAPGQSREVAYTVSIPKGAPGGSHYAGIVALDAADLDHSSSHGNSNGHALVLYRVNRQALPLTIHLPGPLTRGLSLQTVTMSVGSSGAGLVLGLRPRGNELTEGAQVKLRVTRGGHKVFASATGLGQMFPGSALDYRIPWPGTPEPGTYRVVGTIRPQGSPAIKIDRNLTFTPAGAAALKHVTPPATGAVAQSGLPGWVWIALGVAAALMLALVITVYKLARRTRSIA